MSVADLIGSLVGALAVLDGICLAVSTRTLLPIPRWNYPSTAPALRSMGIAEVIGGTGIGVGFAVLAAFGPVPAAVYIVGSGVVGQCLAYGAAWWFSHRARRPLSN
jgi:hypothetical protein